MRYGSLCSGIEAATCAWHPLGWRPQFFSEIDKAASRFLAHAYPDTPNLGDMTKFQEWPDHAIDLLAGGTPCQSFSVAGLRKGLADPRGNLMLTYLAIADRYRPKWLVWENVPGVLSSDGGRDFASFLGGLGQLGYGWAYRVLDAQYVRVESHPWAVPQRRRRVFVVGCAGDWRRAAAVLFERESLSGHPAPRREAGKSAPTIPSRRTAGDGIGTDFDSDGGLIAASVPPTLNAQFGNTQGIEDQHINVAFVQNQRGEARLMGGDGQTVGALAAEPGMKQQTYIAFPERMSGTQVASAENVSPSLGALNPTAIAAPMTLAIRGRGDSHNLEYRQDGTANAILTPNGGRAGIGVGAIATQWAVRRLTPLECERLQGFPDGYTAETLGGKTQADGVRYKQLGNSMAVNCMRWIGERIDAVAKIEVQP